ncbi:hypothetical protein CDL12_07248 [Handroanthus impetiginosus]|uniref:Uncharacterized protein n=1 Tax=Handroanthus impetiginosus TaxID=429701 RepID=A0A2G9HRB6_9LAMI|nr:hypothetical protein CDL12_07248 [Handroanthus impetiginosus]
MNALDSPLEALALNYLSYGFLTAVNSLWAWVAVITAAVSFWRIRALSSQPVLRVEPRSRSQDAASTSSSAPKVAEKAVAEPATVSTTRLSSAPTTSMMCCGNVLESEGGTKTKFSLFYKEDDFGEDNEGGEMEDDGGRDVVVREKLGGWCDDWERMMVLRMGDLGWYRWQDRTVVDGSVVRLWDSCRRRHAAALMVDGGGAW